MYIYFFEDKFPFSFFFSNIHILANNGRIQIEKENVLGQRRIQVQIKFMTKRRRRKKNNKCKGYDHSSNGARERGKKKIFFCTILMINHR